MEMALSPSSAPANQISPWRSAPPQRTPRSSQRTATPRTIQEQKRRRQIRAAACRQWETHHVRRHLSSLWKIHTTLIAMPAQFSPQHSSLSISCTGFIISFCKCSFQAVESLISATWSCSTSSFKIQHQSPWSEYERTWHRLFIGWQKNQLVRTTLCNKGRYWLCAKSWLPAHQHVRVVMQSLYCLLTNP